MSMYGQYKYIAYRYEETDRVDLIVFPTNYNHDRVHNDFLGNLGHDKEVTDTGYPDIISAGFVSVNNGPHANHLSETLDVGKHEGDTEALTVIWEQCSKAFEEGKPTAAFSGGVLKDYIIREWYATSTR